VVLTVGAVAQENVAGFELVPQLAEQAQVVVMQAAPDHVEYRAAVEAKEHGQLETGKPQSFFCVAGWG